MTVYCRNCDVKLSSAKYNRNDLCKSCTTQYTYRKKAEEYFSETGREYFGPEPTYNPLGPIWPREWVIEDYNLVTILNRFSRYVGTYQ